MIKELAIFDLDKTVIDSSHRYKVIDGTQDIDLAHWVENCTPENVAKDSLLPMADVMRAHFETKGVMVSICTARVMSPYDWKFLRNNNLPFHYAMHRPEGCKTGDAELKKRQILKLCKELRIPYTEFFNRVKIFDDNQSVLTMAQEIGIRAYCSVRINKRLLGVA